MQQSSKLNDFDMEDSGAISSLHPKLSVGKKTGTEHTSCDWSIAEYAQGFQIAKISHNLRRD
jgi:hypothetical protein